MKAKNKFEKNIDLLKDSLPKITEEQISWMNSRFSIKYMHKTAHLATCFECGHTWKQETSMETSVIGHTCPKCNTNLKMTVNQKHSRQDALYCTFISTYKEHQVIQHFRVTRFYIKGIPVKYSHHEITQHWINEKGKRAIRGLRKNSSYYRDWLLYSDLSFKDDRISDYYLWGAVYPKKKILPILKRNGLRNCFYKMHLSKLSVLLLTEPKIEILLKTKQHILINDWERKKEKICKYWSSVKICIHNNYKIPDASMWIDHLELLEYLNKDLHCVKYICPQDLRKDHDRLIRKKKDIIKRERLKALKEEIFNDNKIYVKQKKPFLGLLFTNGKIEINVLNSVQEFYDEGAELEHCIFENEYHKKPESLILSAKKENKRLETIELSLKDFSIRQARGKNNQSSRYHSSILKLLNSNISTIKEICKPKKVRKKKKTIK